MNLKNLFALTGLLLAVAGGTIAFNQFQTTGEQSGCCAAKAASCCPAQAPCCEESLVAAKAKACCGNGACCTPEAACCDTGECCGTADCCDSPDCCEAVDAPECCQAKVAVKTKAPCCEASKAAAVAAQK